LPKSPTKRHQPFTVGLVWSNYRLVFRNPKAVLCYSTVFLEGVALYGIMPYVGVILGQHDLGGAREAGFVIGAIGVGGLLYVSLVAVLLRRWKRRQFMAAGGLLMMFGPLGLAFLNHWPTIAAAFAVTGVGFMLLHNSIQTEAVDLAPNARQSAYSLHAFSFFTGQAFGPPLFGFSLTHLGAPLALMLSAAVLAITGAVMAHLFGRLDRKQVV
jgi:predicted MFS family arabinose efflux permease